MKLKVSLLTGAAALSVLALPTFAADPPAEKRDKGDSPARTYERARAGRLERLGKAAKASEIIGMDVQNLQNEKLGEVKELAVDVESGRVVHVIVSSGGILGAGDRTVAVPPRVFTSDEKVLRLDFDKERLKGAPAFDMTKWDESYESNRVAESYRYYGQKPDFDVARERAPSSPTAPTLVGRVEKASKVIGTVVKNTQDEKLGKVEDLVVDLPAGRIAHVVVSSGGFLGIGDALSAVPPTAFRYDKAQEVLRLDVTKEALTKAPHFNRKEWPDFNDPAYVGGVYQAYRVDPYFHTNAVDADNTRLNVRDRRSGTVTPFDQGTSDADVDITRRIRQEILRQKDLSVNARNVKVITRNGRVTLRGPVNSEEEKRLLTDIANRVALGANVDNQLEVQRDQK